MDDSQTFILLYGKLWIVNLWRVPHACTVCGCSQYVIYIFAFASTQVLSCFEYFTTFETWIGKCEDFVMIRCFEFFDQHLYFTLLFLIAKLWQSVGCKWLIRGLVECRSTCGGLSIMKLAKLSNSMGVVGIIIRYKKQQTLSLHYCDHCCCIWLSVTLLRFWYNIIVIWFMCTRSFLEVRKIGGHFLTF